MSRIGPVDCVAKGRFRGGASQVTERTVPELLSWVVSTRRQPKSAESEGRYGRPVIRLHVMRQQTCSSIVWDCSSYPAEERFIKM